MKYTISLFSFFIFTSLIFSQNEKPTRLIIRGDDMGFSHAANEAIIECYKNGIMTTVEVMPITPWFPEVVKLCNENPELDVGIHLTLTAEWSNLKWRPFTYAPSLTDNDGYFHPVIWPNDNFKKGQALSENAWSIEEIIRELHAQIVFAIKHIPHISHVSAHMGFASIDPEVQAVVTKLAKRYKIHIDLDYYGVKRMTYKGWQASPKEKIQSFIESLEALEVGETYLFVEHPGYDTQELQAIHHVGYENVAYDRNGVTKMWTNKKVKAAIKRLGIELINYKDLK